MLRQSPFAAACDAAANFGPLSAALPLLSHVGADWSSARRFFAYGLESY